MDQFYFMSIIIFVSGLIIGSFLNVCIYRIPIHKTIVKGRSYCPNCNHLIPWYQNIPIISFLILRGKCSSCKTPISFRYPIVELLSGILFLAVFLFFGFTWESLFTVLFFSILIVVSFIDIDLRIIPNELIISLLILGAIHAVYRSVQFGIAWYYWVLGFIAASAVLLILGLIVADSIGGGDIKLMAAAGLFVGPLYILMSLFIGAIYAGLLAIFLVIFKKGSLKTAIPFGPFLSMGIITSVLFGEMILIWYLSIVL